MKKTAISVVALIIVLLGGWYLISHSKAPQKEVKQDETVAVVNGEKITRTSLVSLEQQIASQNGASATSTQVEQQALDSLIGQALLRQEVQKSGITASSTVVDAQLAAAKSQFASVAAYQQALSAQGLTEDSLKNQIASNLVLQQYLEQTLHLSNATATDAEIKAAYDQVASANKNVPPLKEVKDQVKQMVLQQKQQQMISEYVSKLRSEGSVQVSI